MDTPRPLGWLSPQTLGRPAHVGWAAALGVLATLPSAVRIEGLPPVYDQGAVGSCTAQALAGAVEVLHARGGYSPERPDRVALYRRERDAIGLAGEDSGAMLGDGVAILRAGYEPERAHPVTWGPAWLAPAPERSPAAPRLVSAEPLAIDVATVCWELAAGHPVVVGLSVTEDWQDPVGAVLPRPGGRVIGGHAVMLVGYRQTETGVEFRVRNSWGETWRDEGEAWLPAEWLSLPWCGEVYAMRAVRRAMGGPDTDRGDAKREMGRELERPSVTDLLDGPVALVERELRASAPAVPPPLAPAVVVTVWDDPGTKRARPMLERLARAAAPGDLAVCVHSTNPSDASVAAVRALGLRLWCALPYDPVARELRTGGRAKGLALARRYADRCARHAPEVVELNGEAAWKPDAAAKGDVLADFARECLDVTRDAFRGPLAWTSFDHLGYHHLPWAAIYGARGVDLATPQVYAAPEKGVGDHHAAAARLRAYAAQWAPLVERGDVRRALAPGGAGHCVYGQVHHLTTAAAAMVLDTSDTSRAWAIPTRSDGAGVLALRALLTARRLHGRRAGAIKRAQEAHGLAADGIAGPKTLAALGLA